MRTRAFPIAPRWGVTLRCVAACAVLVTALGLSTTAIAQSFLGSIRGTVVDSSGGAVPKAAVLVTDEATGVPRSIDTDAEGRYEASNLQPGTYKVEVLTTSFKKFEKTGVVVRASATALVDVTLEVGSMSETVTVTADAQNNITLDSGAISRGLDSQQLRDLPRSTRDIQSFLLLNPNVVGGSDTDIQFLGAKTYGVSYIQDGQASTNAIFGTVGNSAPGLDAVEEIQVLSNSFSAEYGGLAGVVVTTKRGSNAYHGTAFYDFNNDGLNALTYNQTLSGVERGDPLSKTSENRWGGSFGGPIIGSKLFFFGNYEGSKDKAIYGGSRATVPTQAMRNGDFSGTSLHPTDPLTGEEFPGQIIPADRVDPVATEGDELLLSAAESGRHGQRRVRRLPAVPCPRRGTVSAPTAAWTTSRAATTRSSSRGSYQHRDPNSIIFEGGNALTNLPVLDTTLNTASFVGGWTKVLSGTMVNEMRVGYNLDTSKRQSTFHADDVSAQLGLDPAPSLGADRLGFPSINFQSGPIRPTNIADAARNVDRTVDQNAFSISDNFTWIRGAHSFKGGGLWNRNMARDGFGFGVNFRGRYRFNAQRDWLRVHGLPARAAERRGRPGDQPRPARRPFRRFRALRAGRLEAEPEGDGLPRPALRGRRRVARERRRARQLHPDRRRRPPRGAERGRGGEAAARTDRERPDAHRVGRGVARYARQRGQEQLQPAARLCVAARREQQDRAARRLRDLPSDRCRAGPPRPARDERVPLRQHVPRRRSRVTASRAARRRPTRRTSATKGINPNLQSPDIYQYNITVEREMPGNIGLRVSYMGSTMRKLLNDRDFNTLQASTVPFDPSVPEDYARLPFPLYNYYMDIVDNRGEGQFNALQLEASRRYKNGLALNAAYTLAHSDSNAPDTGNATIGPVQFDPYDIEKDRGPDPNIPTHRFVANTTWDVPVGHDRKHGANMAAWSDALFGGWTVSAIFQARSGQHLTPFFSGFYTTSPWNTGKPLDGLGTVFCRAWRPDQIKDPATGGSREAFFDQSAYAIPADGKLGNAKKGSLLGPGTWVANFAFYKDVVRHNGFNLQFSVLLDNAFNHPQFFPTYGSGFVDLTSNLIDGEPDNGTTGVLGADSIGNTEGFSPGRVIRLGLRARF